MARSCRALHDSQDPDGDSMALSNSSGAFDEEQVAAMFSNASQLYDLGQDRSMAVKKNLGSIEGESTETKETKDDLYNGFCMSLQAASIFLDLVHDPTKATGARIASFSKQALQHTHTAKHYVSKLEQAAFPVSEGPGAAAADLNLPLIHQLLFVLEFMILLKSQGQGQGQGQASGFPAVLSAFVADHAQDFGRLPIEMVQQCSKEARDAEAPEAAYQLLKLTLLKIPDVPAAAPEAVSGAAEAASSMPILYIKS